MSTPTLTKASLSTEEAAGVLASLGFPVSPSHRFAQSVGAFQAGWNLDTPLLIDEKLGPKTIAALSASELRRKAGLGTASANFSFSEFACRCHGQSTGCLGVLVIRPLLVGLERLRSADYAHGLSVTSGYRCTARNSATPGAAKDSQHQYGSACDIDKIVSHGRVAALGVFSGIGFGSRSGLVRHVDVRGQAAGTGPLAAQFMPPNPRNGMGTPSRPQTWVYEND